MSRFFSEKYAALTPYTPGEQPKNMQYVKLNTNESPFPPSPGVAAAVEAECGRLQLYCDPDSTALRGELARVYGLRPEQVIVSNGSDDLLNFAFMAFADAARPLRFPDITYGFYPVFAQLNHIPYTEIALKEDFTIDPADYIGCGQTVVIANPNAPTGLTLSPDTIAAIAKSNPDNVVIVDEAYVDFGCESAVPLIDRFDNLLVIQTFSKARSMAGARLGFAMGNAALIADLNTLKYSTNPYDVNRMTAAAGVAALRENEYYMANCRTIAENRAWTKAALEALGFEVTDSRANFLLARHAAMGGRELYLALKARGVLVRYLGKERIKDYNRITIGTMAQMQVLIETTAQVLKECAT